MTTFRHGWDIGWGLRKRHASRQPTLHRQGNDVDGGRDGRYYTGKATARSALGTAHATPARHRRGRLADLGHDLGEEAALFEEADDDAAEGLEGVSLVGIEFARDVVNHAQ